MEFTIALPFRDEPGQPREGVRDERNFERHDHDDITAAERGSRHIPKLPDSDRDRFIQAEIVRLPNRRLCLHRVGVRAIADDIDWSDVKFAGINAELDFSKWQDPSIFDDEGCGQWV